MCQARPTLDVMNKTAQIQLRLTPAEKADLVRRT
jgi:hypothetical protein